MNKITRFLKVLLLIAWLNPVDVIAANTSGDVNNDGEVNIADVNAIINIILSGTCSQSADVNHDGEINIADVNAIINMIINPVVEDEHEFVDLGLPSGTLWATMNVGASSPEEYGDYFAWGETEPKEAYKFDNYKWYTYNTNYELIITKYNIESKYGVVDNKTKLELADDAAYMNWGDSWRMPTSEQYNELVMSCSWLWTSRNGVYGQLVTGPNGNTLFFPAAGYRNNSSLSQAGNCGDYWTCMLWSGYSSTSKQAYCLRFYPDLIYNGHSTGDRSDGRVVRAVRVSQN